MIRPESASGAHSKEAEDYDLERVFEVVEAGMFLAMPELPPIERVPLFSRCPECGKPFRATTSWRPGSQTPKTTRCPWCGTTLRMWRRHVSR